MAISDAGNFHHCRLRGSGYCKTPVCFAFISRVAWQVKAGRIGMRPGRNWFEMNNKNKSFSRLLAPFGLQRLNLDAETARNPPETQG